VTTKKVVSISGNSAAKILATPVIGGGGIAFSGVPLHLNHWIHYLQRQFQ